MKKPEVETDMEDKIMESGEMYLETILILSRRKNLVRSIDVADYMKFSKPAVSRATGKLKESRCIIIDQDGYIALTEKGRAIAEKIYERHTTLTEMLIRLGVDPDTAAKDACKIEHDISDETFDAIKKHIKG
jgi:Mn-dependent DtxR family transcriptional regulator